MKPSASLKSSDCVPIADLAEALRLPASALIEAVEKSRQALNRPFYTIAQLTKRWQCSRNTVSAILRDAEAKLMNLSNGNDKHGRWSIPASVVEHIEKSRMETLPEAKAAYGKAA